MVSIDHHDNPHASSDTRAIVEESAKPYQAEMEEILGMVAQRSDDPVTRKERFDMQLVEERQGTVTPRYLESHNFG